MAVPVAIKARRSVSRALIDSGAITPAGARPLDDLSFVRRRALASLIADGIVREAGPDRYWLDLAAYERWRATRLNRMLWVLLLMAVVLAVLIFLGVVRR